jgi:hypothetical protein
MCLPASGSLFLIIESDKVLQINVAYVGCTQHIGRFQVENPWVRQTVVRLGKGSIL